LPLMSSVLCVRASNPHYLRFPMEDGDRKVEVHIATGWLRERAARDSRSSDNMILLYNFYREEIEAAASVKYDLNHRGSAEVVIAQAICKRRTA
jgi:hypothetical protein